MPDELQPLDGLSRGSLGYSVDQTKVWFERAYELSIAMDAIKRESVNGHLDLRPPLSPDQVKQRQVILGIAHAVIDSARRRALESFHSLQHTDSCEKTEAGGS